MIVQSKTLVIYFALTWLIFTDPVTYYVHNIAS